MKAVNKLGPHGFEPRRGGWRRVRSSLVSERLQPTKVDM